MAWGYDPKLCKHCRIGGGCLLTNHPAIPTDNLAASLRVQHFRLVRPSYVQSDGAAVAGVQSDLMSPSGLHPVKIRDGNSTKGKVE